MNKIQFSLFTLLQESFKEGALPDPAESTERLEQYLLQKFRTIYQNTEIDTENDVLKIQLRNPSEEELRQLEEEKEKIYADFRVELDATTLTRVEEILSQVSQSQDDIEEIRRIFPASLQAMENVNAVPVCQPGDPNCEICERVSRVLESTRNFR